MTLARSVPGIDVIVGGHTQNALPEPDQVNGTLIVQAEDWGKYVGRLDLAISNKKIVGFNYQLIPVNLKNSGKKIPEDPKMLELLKPYHDEVDAKLDQVIGEVTGRFNGDRDVIRSRETELANLITHAMKKVAQADVAFKNAGGIRASLEKGPVTVRQVLTVHPYRDTVARVELKGSELKSFILQAIQKPVGFGGFPHFGGLEIAEKSSGSPNLKINGVALQLDKTYRLALPNFIAAGGDGYPDFRNRSGYFSTGFRIDHVIQLLFEEQQAPTGELPTLDPKDFPITHYWLKK